MSGRATHPCAICRTQIARGLLMCGAHWRLVPRELQQAVNRSWAAFSGARGARAALDARRSYLAARDAAIDSVQTTAAPLPLPTSQPTGEPS